MDFTHCGELGVTIGREPFSHLLFQFVLAICGSGVQGDIHCAVERTPGSAV